MEKKHKFLAEGELTGHYHETTAKDSFVVGDGVDRKLSVPTGTEITHQEHKTIQLPTGDYDITRQREIDPDTEEINAVQD